MGYSLDSRESKDDQTAIGSYQKVRDQINKDFISRKQKSVNTSVVTSEQTPVYKPLNEQKAYYENPDNSFS